MIAGPVHTGLLPRGRMVFLSAAFFALLAVWACGQDDRPGALHVGDQAPDFSVTDMKGGQVTLRQWAGFPVILRFWSTDCQYCRADTPVFNRYFNDYREKGLKVVYLNNGASSAEVESFVQELDIPFPVVLDDGGKVAALYRVKAVPQTIVIDPRQRIIAAILGGVGQAELEELIGTYLDKGGRQ